MEKKLVSRFRLPLEVIVNSHTAVHTISRETFSSKPVIRPAECSDATLFLYPETEAHRWTQETFATGIISREDAPNREISLSANNSFL